jgi:hypothetical protein
MGSGVNESRFSLAVMMACVFYNNDYEKNSVLNRFEGMGNSPLGTGVEHSSKWNSIFRRHYGVVNYNQLDWSFDRL